MNPGRYIPWRVLACVFMLLCFVPGAEAQGPLYPCPLARFGASLKRDFGAITDYDVGSLHIAWYSDTGTRMNPPVVYDPQLGHTIEYVQLVWVTEGEFHPSLDELGRIADANPGSLWLIGNEPECVYQGNNTPEQYAQAYHQLYPFLKSRDPTARIAIGGVVEPTPLRLQWLDRVLNHYQSAYGQPMPVDVWNIHIQILQELRGSWGAEIPRGLTANMGRLYTIDDNDNIEIFKQLIAEFRIWMRDRGQRDKPLIITEFGVLMPPEYGFTPQRVNAFMNAAFNYLLTASSTSVGYAADANHLVQRWIWYSLNDQPYNAETGEGYNGSLFDYRNPSVITEVGVNFRSYTNALLDAYQGACLRSVLGNYVWLDQDRDGIQDAGESGRGGITVRLLNCSGTVLDTTTTSSSGSYAFAGLPSGNYMLEFVLPSGYTFTQRDQGGNDGLDSDADPATGRTACISLTEGEQDFDWDAGVIGPLTIRKYRPHGDVVAGQTFWYYIEVRNQSNASIPGVVVQDTLPTQIAPYSVSLSDGGSINDNIVTWALSSIGPNQTVQLWISASTYWWVGGSYITNEATVSSLDLPPVSAVDVALVLTAPTPTPLSTRSPTPTGTSTPTWPSSPSATPTRTPSATAIPSGTPSHTATQAPVGTTAYTPSPTQTGTLQPTSTNTQTPTQSATPSGTPTGTGTLQPTPTDTRTPTWTVMPPGTPTGTGTLQPTPTGTRTPTWTVMPPGTPTGTGTPRPTTTDTRTPTWTAQPAGTPTRTPTPTAPTGRVYLSLPIVRQNHGAEPTLPTSTATPTQQLWATPTPSRTPMPTATATPSPSRTPLSTPAATPTASHTPRPTTTATPVPSATPQRRQLIINPSFETSEAWVILDTVYHAAYSLVRAHSGSRSMRLGISLGPGVYSYSSVQQAVHIPGTATEAQLSFYYFPIGTPGVDDTIYFCVLRASDSEILECNFWTNYEQAWHPGTFDLLQYAGQDVKVHFGVRNDGVGEILSVYLDDVELWVQ